MFTFVDLFAVKTKSHFLPQYFLCWLPRDMFSTYLDDEIICNVRWCSQVQLGRNAEKLSQLARYTSGTQTGVPNPHLALDKNVTACSPTPLSAQSKSRSSDSTATRERQSSTCRYVQALLSTRSVAS